MNDKDEKRKNKMINDYCKKANKQIIVKAIQYDGSNISDCMMFVGGYKIYQILNFKKGIVINAIEVNKKEKKILNGYYITKATSGKIDVYSENAFKEEFETVSEVKDNDK